MSAQASALMKSKDFFSIANKYKTKWWISSQKFINEYNRILIDQR